MNKEQYSAEVWAWFLKRARMHDGYGWVDLPEKIANHLRECGIDMGESTLPDLGTVSEFTDTFSPNDNLSAVVSERWKCNCGDYGTGVWPRPRKWHYADTLGLSGSYSLSQILSELFENPDFQK